MPAAATQDRKRKAAAAAAAAAAADDEDRADIDRIVDEKRDSRDKVTHYMCTWMDGAEPQWVPAKYLKGSVALDEWANAEEEIPEELDAPEVVDAKVEQLIRWLRKAQRPAWLVGAGLSASVLPTFRGKGGLWTRNAVALPAAKDRATAPDGDQHMAPTPGHHALVALEKAGRVYWVGSQNYDDLFHVAGFPASKLSELHGNIFREKCDRCLFEYHRTFEVELATSKDHETGRRCEQPGCQGELRDNLIHFGEDLDPKTVILCNAKFLGADLTVSVGSSLAVTPACNLPFRAKRRARGEAAKKKIKTIIIALQPTEMDDEADLVIRAKSDDVLPRLAAAFASS